PEGATGQDRVLAGPDDRSQLHARGRASVDRRGEPPNDQNDGADGALDLGTNHQAIPNQRPRYRHRRSTESVSHRRLAIRDDLLYRVPWSGAVCRRRPRSRIECLFECPPPKRASKNPQKGGPLRLILVWSMADSN